MSVLRLRAADGATAEVHQHGAHVTSWCPVPGDEEQLFLSSRTALSGAAIRGGIPVIFPQFAAEGPLPRHGFARTAEWDVESTGHDARGVAVAALTLRDSADTRAMWPHSFVATLDVRVGGAMLDVALTVENTSDAPLSFTAALHTYLRVYQSDAVELVGLHGTSYRESSAPTALVADEAESIQARGEIDRVYVNAPRRLTLREPGRLLDVEMVEFPDVVVWNPGATRAAALDDMEPGGETRMLCVEAAAVQQPIVLDAGRRWSGAQRFFARPQAL